MAQMSIKSTAKNLRFRNKNDSPHGVLNNIEVKALLSDAVSESENIEIHCHTASEPAAPGEKINLSPHMLQSMTNTKDVSQLTCDKMTSLDNKNFAYTLSNCRIVTSTEKERQTNFEKYKVLCKESGIDNNTKASTIKDRKRLCLAFTAYKHDKTTEKRIKLGDTVYSNFIYDCGSLRINFFLHEINGYIVVGLSDHFHEYYMRIWHIAETNLNSNCCEVREMKPLQNEECILGNRDKQKSLRKSCNMYIYKIQPFACPLHGGTSGTYTANIQVYYENIKSQVLSYTYKYDHVTEYSFNFNYSLP